MVGFSFGVAGVFRQMQTGVGDTDRLMSEVIANVMRIDIVVCNMGAGDMQ